MNVMRWRDAGYTSVRPRGNDYSNAISTSS